jgi:hypothetical protein
MDSNNGIISIPTTEELEKVANNFHSTVAAIKIDSPSMFVIADQELTAFLKKVDSLNDLRLSITRPMDTAKKNVMELFSGPIDRCNVAIDALKSAMLIYTKEEKRKAAETQAKIDEELRKERLRLEAEARTEQAEADRQRQVAAAAAIKVVDAERAEAEALAAGDHVAAATASGHAYAALNDQSVATSSLEVAVARATMQQAYASISSAPAVISAAPKIKGLSTSAPWMAEITSLVDLVKYVAANPQYINFLEANMVPIKQQAKSLQANFKIPGVRAYQEERLSRRRA